MIVFTNGCFDILHGGHLQLLKQCRNLALPNGKVIVGLNSDSSISLLKGANRPINDVHSRKSMLEAIRYVDEVIIFEELTPLNLLEQIKPDILVKGGDYTPEDIIGGEHAGRVVVIPYVDGKSTTNIIEKIGRY